MRLVLCLAIGVFAAMGLGADAEAYPQFQFSTGNSRCSLCHYSPSGGGLLTPYGREESSDTISMNGGDGRFLYGAYEEPDWIRLGVDFRGAFLVRTDPLNTNTHIIPMLGDTYVRLAHEDWSAYAAIGPRAQTREAASPIERFGSREHYITYQPSSRGWYGRAGRFHAPFGLRSADHTSYVRRDMGFYIFEETYNLSVGRMQDESELHITAFTNLGTRFSQSGSLRETGGTAYYEKIIGDNTAFALQNRSAVSSESWRSFSGGIIKHYWEGSKIQLLGELDVGLQGFESEAPNRGQLAGYLGATYFPMDGLLTTVAVERFDEDLSVKNVEKDAASLTLQFFPWAKWELIGLGKVEFFGTAKRRAYQGMFQLHYYL